MSLPLEARSQATKPIPASTGALTSTTLEAEDKPDPMTPAVGGPSPDTSPDCHRVRIVVDYYQDHPFGTCHRIIQ